MYPVVVPPTGSEPVHSNHSAMEQDGSDNDNLQATQSQGNASQAAVVDDHLWGFLQPCNAALRRIDLLKVDPICKIGRNRDDNTIVLPGFKVSEYPVLPFVSTYATSGNIILIASIDSILVRQ